MADNAEELEVSETSKHAARIIRSLVEDFDFSRVYEDPELYGVPDEILSEIAGKITTADIQITIKES